MFKSKHLLGTAGAVGAALVAKAHIGGAILFQDAVAELTWHLLFKVGQVTFGLGQ